MISKKITPDLFKKMRNNAGLSQAELAAKMNVSIRTVSALENGDSKITLKNFEKFVLVTTTGEVETERRKVVLNLISDAIDMLLPQSKTKES